MSFQTIDIDYKETTLRYETLIFNIIAHPHKKVFCCCKPTIYIYNYHLFVRVIDVNAALYEYFYISTTIPMVRFYEQPDFPEEDGVDDDDSAGL